MRLLSLTYSEFENTPQYWSLDKITLGPKNLIVGKNSTGKSRTLNVVAALANTLSGPRLMPPSGLYRGEWRGDDKSYLYSYHIVDSQVVSEQLVIDEVLMLDRGVGGFGTIYAEKINDGQMIEFQTPTNEFAITKRRDAIQHSFIEPLYQWAAAFRYYHFGAALGKDQISVVSPNPPALDEKDENAVVGVFRAGVKEFGLAYVDSIVDDMNDIGFNIEMVRAGAPITVRFDNPAAEFLAMQVKERDVFGYVDQISMSQGMYRVLALLVHVNYLQLKGTSTCVVIDDIGEGLDYERSCGLINVLRNKASSYGLQIIMSTNDRFVMNEVPLEEWTVLHRKGHQVGVFNHLNSAEKFDDFRFTGLSNFSFFEMDFLESDQVEDEK